MNRKEQFHDKITMNKLAAVLVSAILGLVILGCGGSDTDTNILTFNSDQGSEVSIAIENARYRVTKPGLGAAFFELKNEASDVILLSGVRVEGTESAELHETMMDADGLTHMAHRHEGFEVLPGQTLSLEPGGKHVMLMGIADGLGDTIVLDLDLAVGVDGGLGEAAISVEAVFDADGSAG